MIAVDTNILVYAHRAEAPFHHASLECLSGLVASGRRWAIPWPCVHEFLSVVTRSLMIPPTPMPIAFDAVQAWLATGSVDLIGEAENHLDTLRELAVGGKIAGPAIHDARIAAICLAHGVRELWSADRDFSRFLNLTVVNPLLNS